MRFSGDLVEHARAFGVLAQELDVPGAGAFERAARKLHLDTSVLRRRLQSLADYAGGALVAGRGRALQLTALGMRIRGLADDLVARAHAIQTRVDVPQRIVVACTEAVGSELLPEALSALRRESPHMTVVVRRLGTEECVARMLAGQVDVGVTRGTTHETRWPAELDATLLCRDRLWIAVPSTHPLGRARTIRLRDIAREPLVLYGTASATRRRVMTTLGPLGAKVVLEVDGRASALAYARRGFGVAFLSLIARNAPRVAGVKLRDVTRLFPPSAFWLVVLRAKTHASARLAELLVQSSASPRH